jgi:hypothetical protein
MSADKRAFTNFVNFPGEINHDTNLYEFPMLYKVADSGKIRQWSIYVRLIKEGSKKSKETKKQNWNLLEEDEVPIKEEYLQDSYKLPDGIISELWTESGIVNMHISRSAASYPKEKNIGKKNERNFFHQALSDARSKYLKKITEGSVLKNDLKNQESKAISDKLYFPMLARKYDDFIKKISYPIYMQPKINGNRCVIYLDVSSKYTEDKHNLTYKDVVMYTRQKKFYPSNEANDNIRKALLSGLVHYYNWKKHESMYIDGELYTHNVSLQSINSEIRGSKSKDIKINYWIYDCFDLSDNNATFHERYELLTRFYNYLDVDAKNLIILTPTQLSKSEKESDRFFSQSLKDKFEGIMYRSFDGVYAKSATKKSTSLRSKDLLKRKPVYEEEFEIVDFVSGEKGTSADLVIWICATKEGKQFKVTPNETNETRSKILQECKKDDGQGFIKKYKNRLLVVEFRDLTDDNIPSHAKAIMIRDFE